MVACHHALKLTLQVCTFTFKLADGIAQGMWNASGMPCLKKQCSGLSMLC